MGWSCRFCTFRNNNDSDSDDDDQNEQICSMCNQNQKTQKKQKQAVSSVVMKQQTLSFGKPLVVGSDTITTTTTTKKKAKKRKSYYSFSLSVRTTPPSGDEITRTLQTVFGFKQLRSLQSQVVITAAIERTSQLVILATGGGKSLCYQLPACIMGGVTFVISPLIALMQDQVSALLDKNIPAACYSSSNTVKENDDILDRLLLRKRYQQQQKKQKRTTTTTTTTTSLVLVYITPESIQTNKIQTVLRQLYGQKRLAMFAVDEAHCVSSWGHDFRPTYRELDWLRKEFNDVPCLACTATATQRVIKDIQSTLHLTVLHKGRLDRHNIFYKVKYKDILTNPMQDLVNLVEEQNKNYCHQQQKQQQQQQQQLRDGGSSSSSVVASSSSLLPCGIVYVHKRDDTTLLAKAISRVVPAAAAYHAGLSKKERQRVQEGWSRQEIPVVVATVAFGMGKKKKKKKRERNLVDYYYYYNNYNNNNNILFPSLTYLLVSFFFFFSSFLPRY